MSKTITAPMQNHIGQEVTTLATCWKVTRTDGREFRFTDHDQDLVVEGQTFDAASGYSRSAVDNAVGMSVDNLEVQGILDNDSISEEEVANGMFDYAEVRIFLVNWQDPSIGVIRLRRGFFGEATLTPSGTYIVELRGLTQLYKQSVNETYQEECRADLGDARCKVPIRPPLVARSTEYAVGDYVAYSNTWRQIPFVNGGFETGDASGWTDIDNGGSGPFVSSSPSGDIDGAQDGEFYLASYEDGSGGLTQEASIPMAPGTIDSGDGRVTLSGWRAQAFPSDPGRFWVEFLDSSGAVLGTLLDTGLEEISPLGTWVERGVEAARIPPGARSIRASFVTVLGEGSNANGCFDNLSGFVDTASLNSQNGRVYRCIESGTTAESIAVDYPVGIDTEFSDGSAGFICERAYRHFFTVTSVADHGRFEIEVDDSRADADYWFSAGAVTWTSGLNSGRSMEIREWTGGDAQEAVLFLKMPSEVQVGDTGTIYPGCQKRLLADCRDKFNNVINFRGEPYIPGEDEVISHA